MASVIPLVVLATLLVGAAVWLTGAVTKESASFWAVIVGAPATLAVFLLGRFADEMTKKDAAAEERRKREHD
ncbi:hypothetical protein J8J27_35290, partial [Mycobacterium tuberculosis]|nr:hypothetical protein [Mycobacterium tuberculosis]